MNSFVYSSRLLRAFCASPLFAVLLVIASVRPAFADASTEKTAMGSALSEAQSSVIRNVGSYVHPEDYGKLVESLRAAGLSEMAIKRIVTDEITSYQLMKQVWMRRELQAAKQGDYWVTDQQLTQDKQALASQKEAIVQRIENAKEERDRLLEQLFGDPVEVIDYQVRATRYEYTGPPVAFLPKAAQQTVHSIWSEFELKAAQLSAERRRSGEASDEEEDLGDDEEGLAEIDQLRSEAYRRIENALSDEDRWQFVFKNSREGKNLRSNLGPFKPTKQEFETLLMAWEEKGWNPLVEEGEHVEEMDRCLKEALGADRLADLQRTRQEGYSDLAMRLLDRGFDVKHLDAIYEVRRAYKAEVAPLYEKQEAEVEAGATQAEAIERFQQRALELEDKVAEELGAVMGLPADSKEVKKLLYAIAD